MAVFRLMMHTGKFLERLVVGVFPAMLLRDAVDVVADVATSSATGHVYSLFLIPFIPIAISHCFMPCIIVMSCFVPVCLLLHSLG